MSRRLAAVLVLAALGLAAAPAGALADTLYAVPSDGSQTGPCGDPTVGCTLATALTLAKSGDAVVLAPGLYQNTNSGSPLKVPAGVTVEGAPGRLRPMINQPSAYTACSGCADVALGDGSALQHVTVRQDPAGGGAISAPASASIRDVVARGAQRALLVSSAGTSAGVVRDSVLSCTAASCRAVAVTAGAADLRNVTAAAPATGGVGLDVGGSSGSASLTGTNVIAQGALDDVSVHATHPATAAVTLHWSSFTAAKAVHSGSGATFSGSDHQVAPAVLVDPAHGDFHEAPGSPTIDAGTTAVGPSGGDPDGHPRVVGAAPDVGAYEFQPAPGVALGPVSGLTRTAATLGATVDPMGAATVVIVEWGPSAAYGFTLPVPTPGSGTGGVTVAATLSGLVPGATYHYRVAAFNDGGVSVTPDATVTTLPPPPVPPAASRRPPPPRCVVPDLAGLAQSAASARLRRAHCRLGRVTRPRGHARGRLVVVRQSPRRGARRPPGQRVAITLGPPPPRRR